MITLDDLELPDELIWLDEFNWNPIRTEQKITLSGVRNIFESKLNNDSGRPITLTSDDAWISRQDIKILFDWSKQLNKTMDLKLHDNSTYQVRFRHIESPVIEYEPLIYVAFVDDDTIYKFTIKLEII